VGKRARQALARHHDPRQAPPALRTDVGSYFSFFLADCKIILKYFLIFTRHFQMFVNLLKIGVGV
jgi:hypothetical protein